MNDIFLDKLEEQQEAIIKLLKVDNDVLGTNYTIYDVLKMIEDVRQGDYAPISIKENSFVLSDVSLFEFLKFFAYVNTDVTFLFFPNYVHIGMLSLFKTLFNLAYGEHCYLSKEKNYDEFYPLQTKFDAIYVYGEKVVFDAIVHDFKNAIWIDSER